jgi:hypothetical protein
MFGFTLASTRRVAVVAVGTTMVVVLGGSGVAEAATGSEQAALADPGQTADYIVMLRDSAGSARIAAGEDHAVDSGETLIVATTLLLVPVSLHRWAEGRPMSHGQRRAGIGCAGASAAVAVVVSPADGEPDICSGVGEDDLARAVGKNPTSPSR